MEIEKICSERGVCCPYMLLYQTSEWQTIHLARELNLSDRSIRLLRNRLRTGEIHCEERIKCKLLPPEEL